MSQLGQLLATPAPLVGVISLNALTGALSITAGNNISVTPAGLNIAVAVSGTTDHAVQIGNASNSLSSLALGTSGQILQSAGAGANPAWTTATYPSTVVIGDVLVASAANVIGATSGATTSGYVLTANGGGTAPTFQAIASGGMFWSREVNAAVAMAQDHGYVNTNVGLTTFTLPAVAALGTVIEIIGESSALWTIAQNAGQNIQYGNVSTTPGVGGSLSATNRYDTVRIVCRVTSTTFSVTTSVGILNVI